MTIKRNVVVVGASGAIGKAFVDYYSKDESVENVFAFSRKKINFENRKIKSFDLDIENQTSIENAHVTDCALILLLLQEFFI